MFSPWAEFPLQHCANIRKWLKLSHPFNAAFRPNTGLLSYLSAAFLSLSDSWWSRLHQSCRPAQLISPPIRERERVDKSPPGPCMHICMYSGIPMCPVRPQFKPFRQSTRSPCVDNETFSQFTSHHRDTSRCNKERVPRHISSSSMDTILVAWTIKKYISNRHHTRWIA
jgi:hypothetical protein